MHHVNYHSHFPSERQFERPKPGSEHIFIDNTTSKIRRIAAKIGVLVTARNKHNDKLNRVRKFLQVALDDKLMRLAIYGDSYLRNILNGLLHKQNTTPEVVDALANLETVLEKARDDRAEGEEKFPNLALVLPTDLDLKVEAEKLMNVVYGSENYFSKGDTVLEDLIDIKLPLEIEQEMERMKSLINQNKALHGTQYHTDENIHYSARGDIHVLLSWLEEIASCG